MVEFDDTRGTLPGLKLQMNYGESRKPQGICEGAAWLSSEMCIRDSGYTVLSEMVATDRKENNVAIIPGKMAFHQKDMGRNGASGCNRRAARLLSDLSRRQL